MEAENEQHSQDEIQVRLLLEKFFVQVSEMPMIEQVKVLRDFQDFLAEQREKQHSVSP